MNHSLAEIEDAIIATLGPLHQDHGGPVRKIDSYSGEFDVDTLEQFIVTFPVILVAYAGSGFKDTIFPYLGEEAVYTLIIGDRSMRQNRDARVGSAQAVGTYSLLRQVKQRLHGSTLGLGINKCIISRVAALANTRTLSLYSAEFRITQDIRE